MRRAARNAERIAPLAGEVVYRGLFCPYGGFQLVVDHWFTSLLGPLAHSSSSSSSSASPPRVLRQVSCTSSPPLSSSPAEPTHTSRNAAVETQRGDATVPPPLGPASVEPHAEPNQQAPRQSETDQKTKQKTEQQDAGETKETRPLAAPSSASQQQQAHANHSNNPSTALSATGVVEPTLSSRSQLAVTEKGCGVQDTPEAKPTLLPTAHVSSVAEESGRSAPGPGRTEQPTQPTHKPKDGQTGTLREQGKEEEEEEESESVGWDQKRRCKTRGGRAVLFVCVVCMRERVCVVRCHTRGNVSCHVVSWTGC